MAVSGWARERGSSGGGGKIVGGNDDFGDGGSSACDAMLWYASAV